MSKENRPVVVPPEINPRRPVVVKPSKPKCWAFSFRFWRQIEYFGLAESEPKWFISLLEKLADLSAEPIDDFLADPSKKGRKGYRYHDISWTQKNIPIQRADLTWLERDYQNEAEYPLVQFQLSKALGRIVGFWNENHELFYLVLLDPLHNIQPCKEFDYQVRPASPLPCKYTSLLHDIERVKPLCTLAECEGRAALHALPSKDHFHSVTILYLDEGVQSLARGLITEKKAKSFADIVEAGVLACLDRPGPNGGGAPSSLGRPDAEQADA